MWFIEFTSIGTSPKFNKEILKIICPLQKNTEQFVTKIIQKLLKPIPIVIDIDNHYFPKYCLKINDSYQAKRLNFILIIIKKNETLEFSLNFKESSMEEFELVNQDLIKYLKEEVVDKIFINFLIHDE